MVVYDTYAWIEYFRGSEKGLKVRELLKRGGYTPSIVLAEIARKYVREGVSPDEVRKRLLFIETRTKIISMDSDLAVRAAKVFMELYNYAKERKLRKPSLADAIVYSIAQQLEENLVTGDKLFKDLLLVLYIGD